MLNIISIICFVLMVLMFVWILKASHNICGAIQAILDIQHSRDKIENLACRRVMELQADKGRLTDEVNELKKRFEPQAFTEVISEVGENYNNKVRLAKATEILSALLKEEKENMYWEMNGSDKSSYFEVVKKAEAFLKESE